jgi:hypothetical protein
VLLAAAVLGGVACSGGEGTQQLAEDPADERVEGNLPTAPPPVSDTEGLGSGANAFLAELDEVREERDLCRILTGAAFADLVTQRADPSALVTNPAGVSRLLASLDATFSHLVDIAPAELVPAVRTVRDVWTRLATIGPVDDAEARANEVLSEPEVATANEEILRWAALNCFPDVQDGTPPPPAG